MDSTWFPFDEQICMLVYEPWKYSSDEVNVTTYIDDKKKAIVMYDLQLNDLWEFLGKCLRIPQYSVLYKLPWIDWLIDLN